MNSYLRRGATLVAALALTAALPAAAHAATLTNAGGTLTYAGNDSDDFVEFSQADPAVDTVRVSDFSTDDAITSSGCTVISPTVFDCAGVSLYVASGAGGDDNLFPDNANAPQMPGQLSGGNGNDNLTGGDGADALSGGAGDDSLFGGLGTDALSGGTGVDSALLDFAAAGGAVSLDGLANDGIAGENDNIGADIEDVSALGTSAVAITGNASANVLSGDAGNDGINGGAGNDTLNGFGGNDTIDARDGFADRVTCGAGTDTVLADTLDVVSDTCENVSTTDMGNANEDKPPAIAWTAPAANAKFAGSKLTSLMVTATDDKAVAKVVFMDDDRVVCTDTVAPYTCAYQARGADLGRNTLTATASDAAGQTASSVRVVTVTRFSAKSVSLKVSHKGSRYTATGKVTLPAGVSKAQGCKGTTVKVTAKGVKRSAKVRSSCSYRVSITSGRSGLKFKAAYSGNDIVAPRSSRTVSAR